MALTTESALRKDKRNASRTLNGILQHRHFAVIAGILAEMKPSETQAFEEPAMRDQWRDTVLMFAQRLAETNVRFDRKRFLTACGI